MTPAPTLEELIASVHSDAASADPLDQLSEAARMAASLEEAGDRLVGHFVDQSRIGGHSWSQISVALGVSKQAVHKRFSVTGQTFDVGSPTFERFTPRAREALSAAAESARERGGAAVEAGDLLVGLFKPAEGIAALVLSQLWVTREACVLAVTATATEATEAAGAGPGADAPGWGRLPFSESARAVLKRTLEEALSLGHNYIGTEHLLLGIFHDPKDPAAQTLIALGVGYDEVKAAIAKEFTRLSKG